MSTYIYIYHYFILACSKYAEILAAQGCLDTAMGYLMAVNEQVRPALVNFFLLLHSHG